MQSQKEIREEFMNKKIELGCPCHQGEGCGCEYFEDIANFFLSKFSQQLSYLEKEVEKLAGQNNYEGKDALVYRTTIEEVLHLINKYKE